ncbi:MAG TPA: 16S rRNA (uracil(1498)-N(3))-methyltransferase [Verrucomicrobiae bacterium]|nr:16S rRNA (uracil(1498)-N(3))-methyltransferase [Verrucomicrobiae bacterium]
MHRFFLPNLQQPLLLGTEAHHVLHVLRVKTDEIISVFDGQGQEAQARIAEITRDSVRLTLLQRSSTPQLACRITLAQAIPKKNMDFIVQKATELGVTAIMPLMTQHTVVQLDDESKKLRRWQEIALEACKQCGNNWLPEIQPPQKLTAFLNSLPGFDLKLIGSLQPDAQSFKNVLSGADSSGRVNASSILMMVGPEGDFTPAELSLAKSAGCVPLSLGPLVLRADTAAIYALSVLRHEMQNG